MLPDPYATEPTREIDPDRRRLYEEALDQAEKWKAEADRLKALIVDEMMGAHSATINGVKVFYNRPQSNYAIAALKNGYPDLVQHFEKWVQKKEIDMVAFAAAHPEIAEQFRVRAFRRAGK